MLRKLYTYFYVMKNIFYGFFISPLCLRTFFIGLQIMICDASARRVQMLKQLLHSEVVLSCAVVLQVVHVISLEGVGYMLYLLCALCDLWAALYELFQWLLLVVFLCLLE